jgi:hypothetical protein
VSNHAARRARSESREPNGGRYALYVALPLVAGFIIAISFITWLWNLSPTAGWPMFQAQILETRIAIIGSHERGYQGAVDYRVEALVRFQSNGVTHDAWLPASKSSNDKLFLEFWLSQHSKKSALVLENPANPKDLFVILD